jgi:hypothetical protein
VNKRQRVRDESERKITYSTTAPSGSIRYLSLAERVVTRKENIPVASARHYFHTGNPVDRHFGAALGGLRGSCDRHGVKMAAIRCSTLDRRFSNKDSKTIDILERRIPKYMSTVVTLLLQSGLGNRVKQRERD